MKHGLHSLSLGCGSGSDDMWGERETAIAHSLADHGLTEANIASACFGSEAGIRPMM